MMKPRKLIVLLLCLLLLFPLPVFAAEETEDGEDEISVKDVLMGKETIAALFSQVFQDTIGKWLADLLNAAIEKLDALTFSGMKSAFQIEKLFDRSFNSTVLTTSSLERLYNFTYGIALVLVSIKFMFKGFQIYVLWKNGDADASPRDMLMGAVIAEVVMVSFPYLYGKAVNVLEWITTSLMDRLGGADPVSMMINELTLEYYAVGTIISIVIMLIWAIMAFVLWVRVMMQGIELLVLRVGLPFATLGLIDSDMALFKNYIQIFVKTFLTLMIQILLMSASMRLILSNQTNFVLMLFGVAVMCVAMTTPKLLQQFMVPQQGSGIISKASSAAMLARSIKSLLV